jgi:hypothetical protein
MRFATRLLGLVFLFVWLAPRVQADVAILLEEPYSYDGGFAGAGHAAIYLTRVCSESPTLLRRCRPGETGAVLSRYHRMDGYDWIAVPLTAYLYAVDTPGDVPLYADGRLVALLRDRYRREHLEGVAHDNPGGKAPGGDWPQLVGEAYDRTLYGFQIQTSASQDDEFIRAYNSQPNVTAYNFVSNNCADFVREVVNFYYPNAVKRSLTADLDLMSPKHAAKSLVQYSKHHPELHFTSLVIPQVPGTIRRSRPVRGLLESVFMAKKYEAPIVFFHPFAAAGFASAYLLGGRFNPAHNALVYDPSGDLERPLTAEQRRKYSKDLSALMRDSPGREAGAKAESWKHIQAGAQESLDESGRPVIEVPSEAGPVQIGLSRANVLNSGAAPELAQGLLEACLREELRRGRAPKVSDIELKSDWLILQSAISRHSANAAGLDLSSLRIDPY